MSTNTILGFIAGVVAGALAMLLLAPKSGEELRADMAREARARQERIKQEVERTNKEMHERMDKLQVDVQSSLDHLKEQSKPAGEVK